MKKRPQILLHIVFTVSAFLFLILMLTGCSDTGNTPPPQSHLTLTLQRMQGHWETPHSDTKEACTAIIQEHTIRLRYQADEEQPQLKINAGIERLDEQRNLIILHGGTGAWPYEISTQDGLEHLVIEFFGHDGWHRLDLCRAN